MLAVFLLEFLEIVCMTKGSKVAEWEAPPFLSTPTRQELSMLVYGGASTVFSDYTKLRKFAPMAVKGGTRYCAKMRLIGRGGCGQR